jgi:mycothiol synthase
MTIKLRRYAGESDLQGLSDLYNACEAVDKLGQGESFESLRNWLGDPALDLDRDFRVWEDADGTLIGCVDLSSKRELPNAVDVWLRFSVHPSTRQGELGMQMLTWAAEQMHAIGRQRGVRATITTPAREHEEYRIALLEQCSFTVGYRELTMVRSLIDPIQEFRLPTDFTLRPLTGAHEVAAWMAVLNDAYRDIHDPYPLMVDARLQAMTQSDYKPELDLIVAAPHGTLAGFCWCWREDGSEGWIRRVGTRPRFRKLGLGRAMLLEGLHRLKADGATSAGLYVDAANTVATRLYQSLGFRTVDDLRHYTQDV